MGPLSLAWRAAAFFAFATASDPPELPEPRLVAPRDQASREAALRRHGGSRLTEEAVTAGLDWLARHQREDRSWDADGFPERCERGAARCDGPGRGHHGEASPCPFDAPITARRWTTSF